ncbi:MAG: glycosyltransferase [Halocynthiibacter sp.]
MQKYKDTTNMQNLPRILFTTRFSFFGNSGWKSEFSADPAQLFEESRLKKRLWLFEHVTLPCLTQQTDQEFHHFILSSAKMPQWAKEALNDLCAKNLKEGQYTIRYARPARARKFQRFMIGNLTQDETTPVAQVVLDDDDALPIDFVEILKSQMAIIKEDRGLEMDKVPYFITFPRGYALGLRDDRKVVWHQRYPFINLGLTMIGTSQQQNILGIAHKAAPKRFGYMRYDDQKMYVRSINDVNDSRVIVKDKWTEVSDAPSLMDIELRFPYMKDIDHKAYKACS